MPITTADFSSLTDDLQEVFNEAASVGIAESVGMTVFEVKETNRRTYDYLVVHGLDVIKSVAQGADLPVASTDQGRIQMALNKPFLINGETFISLYKTIKATLNKLIEKTKNPILQLQRLSEMESIKRPIDYATVRS
jgi:hypothetical protein